jgi:hypothetical protein
MAFIAVGGKQATQILFLCKKLVTSRKSQHDRYQGRVAHIGSMLEISISSASMVVP